MDDLVLGETIVIVAGNQYARLNLDTVLPPVRRSHPLSAEGEAHILEDIGHHNWPMTPARFPQKV
jgi:hypothetical protein